MTTEDKSGNDRSVRVWQQLDLNTLKQHLLLIDDLYGTCAACNQIGLNYLKDKSCSGCGTEFKYLATRLKDPAETGKILRRIEKEKLGLTLIDREDYEKAMAEKNIGSLFKEPE
ncbi:MAG: hypothetical protein CMF59_03030 [Leptospiraceae bacterium]|nr:hypothetical protein [Leptospiraceae bacterium]